MRIAQIAPLHESVPPRLYGGTERVVAHLSDALADRGHEVTLFASGDSRTRAKLHPARDVALRLDDARSDELAAHLALLDAVRERADAFDVLHFHLSGLHFPLFESWAARTVTTLHGRLDLKDLGPLFRRWSSYPLVSISDAQRAPWPDAHWAGTVYHGYPREQFTFGEGGDHLVFLGRMSPEKRPDRAIRIALAAGRRIKLAAKVDPVDRGWFEANVAPLLDDPRVEFVGEIGEAEKSAFLGSAAGLLFPIDWPEPFGLVMIEAMGCGTPVIAYDAGSVPEVVVHGQTGFVVRDEAEAVEAVRRLDRIDRRNVRRVFERRFSIESMAERYEAVYERLAGLRAQPRVGLRSVVASDGPTLRAS